MPRKTRAAAKAQHILPDGAPGGLDEAIAEEASTAPLPTPPSEQDRGALRSITPNSTEIADTAEVVQPEMKRSKGAKNRKGKKKGKKGKADKVADVGADVEAVEEQPDEPEATAAPMEVEETAKSAEVGDTAAPIEGEAIAASTEVEGIAEPILVEEPAEPIEEAQENTPIETPVSPTTKPARMTRRQLAMAEKEDAPKPDVVETSDAPSESVNAPDSAANGETDTQVEPKSEPEEPTPELGELAVQESVEPEDDPVAEPVAEPVVKPVADKIDVSAAPEELEDSQSPAQPDAVENDDVEPETVESETVDPDVVELDPAVAASTPSAASLQPLETVTSPALPLTQPEDPIDAIDALEDVIEELGKVLPDLDAPSPVKPQSRIPRSSPTASPTSSVPKATKIGPPALGKLPTKAVPSVRTAAANKLVNSTQPSATTRMRVPATTAIPKSSSLARSTSTRTKPASGIATPATSQAGRAPDHLAAKRQAASVQFPTPPPPPKSTKPPTKAAFQLPGDAIAAKLKAQRQERLKREEEEAAKRKAFKARPLTKPSKPADVKQTAASRARLSVVGGVESTGNKENRAAEGGLKRSSTVTGATSSRVKHGSTVTDGVKRSSVMGPPSVAASKTSTANTAQKRSSTHFAANKDFSVSVPKRQPLVLPNSTAKRVSSIPSPLSSSAGSPRQKVTVTAQDVAVQRLKGKEVFNRDKVEKEARERERREKDEAMKRARAEAAERGRQASRDWAEKQKKGVMERKASVVSIGAESTTA